jgi:hypothetical protein
MRGLCLLALIAAVTPLPVAAQTDYPPEVLEDYMECMERHDLDAIKELLWYHREVERIDASIYGLPPDDFDDDSKITIAERLEFRASQVAVGTEQATSGPTQYPHFLRAALDHRDRVEGRRPDCSLILSEAGVEPPQPEDLGSGWGSDLNLSAADSVDRGEVDIIVDRADPSRVFASAIPIGGGGNSHNYFATDDHGQTWRRGLVGNTQGTVWSCDPVSYYDNNAGFLYHGSISCTTFACSVYQHRMRRSSDNGVTWSDCGRPGNADNEDRPWFVVDNTPTSACYGTLYTTYHVQNTEKVVRSTDQCTTWTERRNLSAPFQAITPDINVAADGHVYVIWSNHGDHTIRLSGSNSCGADPWLQPLRTQIAAHKGDWKNYIPAQCQRGVSPQPSVDVDRAPESEFFGRVYVTYYDFNQTGCGNGPGCSNWTSTCNYDMYFAYSDDEGATFSTPTNLTAGDGNLVDNFMGYMRVDEADGSIYVGYHRSRLNPTSLTDRQKTHFFVKRSTDGGATWDEPFQASSLEGDERRAGANTFERGDYNRMDVHQGVVWPIWVDRRDTAGEEEIITRKLCSEPTHWSERAPTFAAPEITVADGGNQSFNLSWELPDLYWGDGGEDPGARHFELWVDGALEVDDIPATSTSTTWAAPDCSSRSFVVRAVNQCGVGKDYASAIASCCDDNPGVDVTPDGPVTLCDGTAQTLTANLTGGGGPFDYQWLRDDAVIPGASGATYQANDGGAHTYNCEVMGTSCSEASSDPAPTSIVWQLAPTFAGLESVIVSDPNDCALLLSWSPATSACPGPFTYNVYRSTTPGFTPDVSNRIATGVVGTSYDDTTTEFEEDYYYVVRAVDTSNGAEDDNTVEVMATCGLDALFADGFESGDTTEWANVVP